jgi:putative ATP-dependent endonuclease of OLD family
MIERIIIKGYRCFRSLDIQPNPGMNIIVGDNESGKSTLLEAIALALTGKANGHAASEEVNPFWFNNEMVADFFAKYGTPEQVEPPTILIELYFGKTDPLQDLRGMVNSQGSTADCPGISMSIAPSNQYKDELADYMRGKPPPVLPVEFYRVEWRDFGDHQLQERPKGLATAFIDSRTIRSTSGVDYYTRQMLSDNLDGKERAKVSVEHRKSKQHFTDNVLQPINQRIAEQSSKLHDLPIGLQMDQSSRSSWETDIVPQVGTIPFAMSGQGRQASIKVALAMSRSTATCRFVLVEEPENHLSYGSLHKLVDRIATLAQPDQQLFVTTHSSFVLNRLGLDRLLLLHGGTATKLTELTSDTVNYFRKLAGYDTLRLVLAHKLALVEGPADCIVLERAYRDVTQRTPTADGVDIVTMGGLTFKRAFELCACLGRPAVGLQDNDGRSVEDVRSEVADFLEEGRRIHLVSDSASGRTLEPQIVRANSDSLLRSVLGRTNKADLETWMTNNKTEAALLIFDASESITFPDYINEAVGLLQ